MTLNLTAEEKIARRKEYKRIHSKLLYNEIKQSEPEKHAEILRKANEKAKQRYRLKNNITDETTVKKQKKRNFKVVLEDKVIEELEVIRETKEEETKEGEEEEEVKIN